MLFVNISYGQKLPETCAIRKNLDLSIHSNKRIKPVEEPWVALVYASKHLCELWLVLGDQHEDLKSLGAH